MKVTLNDGTELIKGNFYKWSGSSERYRSDYRWEGVFCKILDINNEHVTIFDIFANEENCWSLDSLNQRCTFKKLWIGRFSDWFKKVVA